MIMRMMSHRGFVLTAWGLAALIILEPGATAMAVAQDSCAVQLNNARKLFESYKLDASIAVIEKCLKNANIPDDEQVIAYDLLAQCYVKKQDPALLPRAREAIQNVLQRKPDFQPSGDAEDGYKMLLEEEREKISTFPKTWHYLAAGGAVVVGVLVWLLWPKEEDRVELPGPPGRPGY